MITSYSEHCTADNLPRNRWGKYMLSKTDDNMISLYDGKHSPIEASEIWLYGNESNGNILTRIFDDNDNIYKYALLTPWASKKVLLRDISKEVYDGKYRITRDTNDKEGKPTVSIISESDGRTVVDAYKWKDITDINNGLAIVEINDGVFVLYNLKDKRDLIGYNYDICEIVNVVGSLYKYKKKGESGYYLYNAQTGRNSDDKRPKLCKDVEKISDFLVMVTFDDMVCFVRVDADNFNRDYIGAAKSQLHIDNDKRIISFYGWYSDEAEESDVIMDFDGNRLNQKKEPGKSVEEIVASYNRLHPNSYYSPTLSSEKTLETDNETVNDDEVSIVRCWVYTGETKFATDKTLSFDKSFRTKRLKKDSLVAWVLPAIKRFIVAEAGTDGFLQKRVKIESQNRLEEGLLKAADSIEFKKNKNTLRLKGVWQGRRSELQGMICESLNQQLEEQKTVTSDHNGTFNVADVEKTGQMAAAQRHQQADTIERESLLLKEVYVYLQGKGFNDENISDTIFALFPGFEHRLLDANNDVRVNNPQLFKDIDKYTEYRDNRDNLDYIKSRLKLSDRQKEQLEYRLVVKGNTFAEALRSVDGTGEASKTYSEIMDSNDRLKKLWKQVGQLVIDEIAAYQMEPTKEYRQELEQDLTRPKRKSDGKVTIPLKDDHLECSLDDVVSYSVFQKWKKVTNSTVAFKYAKVGHNIFLFLNKEKADEIDKAGNPIIANMPGEGKTGEQTIGLSNINSDLCHQKERGIRILVFVRNNDDSCRFFDEFEVLKVEENTSERKITCTFKSQYRFQ